MTETVLDRSANKRADLECERNDTQNIVSDLRTVESMVEYKNIESQDWNVLCGYKELARRDVDKLCQERDSYFSDDIRRKIHELRDTLSCSLTDDMNMYRLEPKFNDKGQIKELVIPMETSISEDIVIKEIYQGSEFVASDIEEGLGEENIYRLRTNELFTKSIDSTTLYTRRKMDFEEELRRGIRDIGSNVQHGREIYVASVVSLILLLGSILLWTLPVITALVVGIIPGFALMAIFMICYVAPIVVPWALLRWTRDLYNSIHSAASSSGNYKYIKLSQT
jgi:hypothetical protein